MRHYCNLVDFLEELFSCLSVIDLNLCSPLSRRFVFKVQFNGNLLTGSKTGLVGAKQHLAEMGKVI
jgi:hypothetical protein